MRVWLSCIRIPYAPCISPAHYASSPTELLPTPQRKTGEESKQTKTKHHARFHPFPNSTTGNKLPPPETNFRHRLPSPSYSTTPSFTTIFITTAFLRNHHHLYHHRRKFEIITITVFRQHHHHRIFMSIIFIFRRRKHLPPPQASSTITASSSSSTKKQNDENKTGLNLSFVFNFELGKIK